MSEFHSLVFAEPAKGGQLSDPFPVLYVGKFKRSDFGERKITAADLDRALENFERFKPIGGVPIDKDHSFGEGGSSEALGWIRELSRAGDRLMARVEWTDEGAELIRTGKFRLFSPEFSWDWVDEAGDKRGFALLAGALTNRPFLKGLSPVCLSEKAKEVVAEEARDLAALSGQQLVTFQTGGTLTSGTQTFTAQPPEFVLPATADAASERRRTMAEPNNVELPEADLVALREKAEKVDTFAERLKAVEESNTALKEKAEQAETKFAEAAKELAAERFNQDFAQAQREGRVDAKDETRAKWQERYEKFGRDDAKALLFELPAETIPMSERGHGKDAPEAAGETPEGVDPISYRAHVRAEQIAAERSISYEEAAPIAFAEVTA